MPKLTYLATITLLLEQRSPGNNSIVHVYYIDSF